MKLLGPVQAKVALVSGVVAEMTTLVTTQVMVFPVAEAPGALVLEVTLAVAVLVQVVMLSVTTTLYDPDTFTVGLCSEEEYPLGPVQLKVGLAALVEVVRLIDDTRQFSVPLVVAREGAGVPVTLVTAVCVQPLTLLVTFKVYVPAAFTTGVSVVLPLTMFPPPAAVHK